MLEEKFFHLSFSAKKKRNKSYSVFTDTNKSDFLPKYSNIETKSK